LPAGPVELRAGSVRLRMTCGAELLLRAPVRAELADPKSVRLQFGSLIARVPDAGIGFRVTTPQADVVDLGTEFGVPVDDNGSTEIHVAEGTVVARSNRSAGVVSLLRHEAGRIDADLSEIAPVPFDPSLFG
jgi:ferric-dicitrate binding protein FerR (iron transport regulator)